MTAVCSIEGCGKQVLARGWCGKHYSRWQRSGDPLVMVSTRLKGDPNVAVESIRFIRGQKVFFAVDGRAFVEVPRVRNGERSVGRRYGSVFICEHCKQEPFAKANGQNRLRFCSHKCAGPASRDSKLGRTKSPSHKARVAHLDRLFSVLVRSAGVCVHCGSTQRLQCAHGFSRRYRTVRWDFRNAFCLCQRCHLFFTHRPLEWDEWLQQRWGADLYASVRAAALRTDRVDLDAVRNELVQETQQRGITANQLPKSVPGWEAA